MPFVQPRVGPAYTCAARFPASDTSVGGTARAIVEWQGRTGRTGFSVSRSKDSLRWLAPRPGETKGALEWLEQRGAVVREGPGLAPSRRGRPRREVYPELRSRGRRE